MYLFVRKPCGTFTQVLTSFLQKMRCKAKTASLAQQHLVCTPHKTSQPANTCEAKRYPTQETRILQSSTQSTHPSYPHTKNLGTSTTLSRSVQQLFSIYCRQNHSTAQHYTTPHSSARYSTARPSKAQQGMARLTTTQHSTAGETRDEREGRGSSLPAGWKIASGMPSWRPMSMWMLEGSQRVLLSPRLLLLYHLVFLVLLYQRPPIATALPARIPSVLQEELVPCARATIRA